MQAYIITALVFVIFAPVWVPPLIVAATQKNRREAIIDSAALTAALTLIYVSIVSIINLAGGS